MRRLFPALLCVFVLASASAAFGTEPHLGRCFLLASRVYRVDPKLLVAIAYVESSLRHDALNFNRNGTVDIGIMQVNSCWRERIRNWHLVKDSPCFNVLVGAWILRRCIDTYGLTWDAVACYNTGRGLSELSGERRRRAELYVYRVYRVLTAMRRYSPGASSCPIAARAICSMSLSGAISSLGSGS